jgi:hypothetical protein
MSFLRTKPDKSSPMSEFIRNAKSRDKNRTYREVLLKATKRQEEVLQRSGAVKVAHCG